LPFVFEAISAVVVALGGVVSLLAGSVVLFGIDRATLSRAIDAGVSITVVEPTRLTRAESIELLSTVLAWTGTGLVIVGVAMLGFTVAYLGFRHRTRRGSVGWFSMSEWTAAAVIGSAAAGLLSFLPGSAGLGGAVAGYLESGGTRRTASVGALAGVLLTIPAILVSVFVLGGLGTGLVSLGFTDSAVLVVVVMSIVVLFVAAVNVGLGALGGYVGGVLGTT
jgi:hypothetical protein